MSFKELKTFLIKYITSCPQLISKLLVAPACLHVASDWPRTFLYPRCYCLASRLMIVSREAKKQAIHDEQVSYLQVAPL